jgi:hypothetical protein
MFKQLPRLASLAIALVASACAADGPDSGSRTGAIIDVPCAEGPECPAGFECEVEEEAGVVTSFCQADGDSDPGCPAGYEAEIEHGQVFCQPHDQTGDDNGTAGDDDLPGDDNGAGTDDAPGDDTGAGTDDPAGDDTGVGTDDPAGDDTGAGTDDPAGDDTGAGTDDAPHGDDV